MKSTPAKAWEQPKLPTVDDITEFDRKLMNYWIMRKMRDRFGEKPYNLEKLFPDPRKKRLTRSL